MAVLTSALDQLKTLKKSNVTAEDPMAADLQQTMEQPLTESKDMVLWQMCECKQNVKNLQRLYIRIS